MTIQTTTLKPGLLVSLNTSIRGNVRYDKKTIESDHTTDDGARRARWETERVISDPVEHEAATRARAKARSLISAVCVQSTFGMLCPEGNADMLESAIADARAVAEAFNARAQLTRVSVNVLTGRIAADDVEAVRAINSEVRQLLEDMESGVKALDAKAVRDAASKAKGLGAMLSPDAAKRIEVAVNAARDAAKRIVKAGEAAATVIDETDVRRIVEARTAFLDIDGEAGDIKVNGGTGRAIDFDPFDSSSELTAGQKAAATRKRNLEAARQIEV